MCWTVSVCSYLNVGFEEKLNAKYHQWMIAYRCSGRYTTHLGSRRNKHQSPRSPGLTMDLPKYCPVAPKYEQLVPYRLPALAQKKKKKSRAGILRAKHPSTEHVFALFCKFRRGHFARVKAVLLLQLEPPPSQT